MSLRRSSRAHKPPKWIDDFEPCDTSTPIHPDKGAIDEVKESNHDHIWEPVNPDRKAVHVITPTTTDYLMTHPKSKKPSGTSQALVVTSKRAMQVRNRSRSRSRSSKSTPTKSARRAPVSESVGSPELREISGVTPKAGCRRSTRLAERSMNGFAKFENTGEEQKDTASAVTLHNNASFFHVDLLSNKPRLMTFLQLTVLLIYLVVFYKLCIHFGADKFFARLLHKLG